MIPRKGDNTRKEYIKLHYKLLALYRKHYPYMPFRRIQKQIIRKMADNMLHTVPPARCRHTR